MIDSSELTPREQPGVVGVQVRPVGALVSSRGEGGVTTIVSCDAQYHDVVPTVHVVDTTRVAPERVLEAARDFSERRADLWPDVHVEHLRVHERGDDFAVVTEGNRWPIGHVWERLRYDWSTPGVVSGTVLESNLFTPGSTWEISATPTDAGTRVEVVAVRHLRGIRGWMIYPFFPLGMAKRSVAEHLRHFLSVLEGAGP